MKDPARKRTGRGAALVVLLSIAAAVLALPGCGGSDGGDAARSPASQPSVAATPAAPSTEAEVMTAYAQTVPRLQEPGAIDELMALYADDARMEDRAYGATSIGKDQIWSYWTQYFATGQLSDKVVSTYTGNRCALVESLAYSPGVAALPTAEVMTLDGGLITRHYVYYYDGQIGREAEPLQTDAAADDTEAASLQVATDYLAALCTVDATALGTLYAADVVYRDTAHKKSFAGADAAVQAHAAIFAMKGVEFVGDEAMAGPGWAAVLWRRTDREGRQIPYPADLPDDYLRLAKRPTVAGVSVLEIRGGRIARETVYCDHLRTRW